MKKEVLLVGYGSIGSRHAANLIKLGIKPYILTQHPSRLNALFLKNINELKNRDIGYCVISSPTAKHLHDLKQCLSCIKGLRNILIEKPLESSLSKGEEIARIARKNKLKVYVAYNLRFLKAFSVIRKFIQRQKNRIKIVEVVAGQDLREWRPQRDVSRSYSAIRKQGGGVDLDLSHEIDYVLWLFGDNFKDKIIYRDKISNLRINSPDIFKLILKYDKFVVDITLDYIRKPKERYLKIICDDSRNLFYDLVVGRLTIEGKTVLKGDDINRSYKKILKTFLGINKDKRYKLCPVEDALRTLKAIGV